MENYEVIPFCCHNCYNVSQCSKQEKDNWATWWRGVYPHHYFVEMEDSRWERNIVSKEVDSLLDPSKSRGKTLGPSTGRFDPSTSLLVPTTRTKTRSSLLEKD